MRLLRWFRGPVQPRGVRVRLVNGDTVTPIYAEYTGVVNGMHHWAYLLPSRVTTAEFAGVEVEMLPARTVIDIA